MSVKYCQYYCNAACKKKNRKKHKKECEREMSTTTFEISEPDEALFKDPHVTSATNPKASIYKACCGKTICLHLNETKEECPFCRASYSGDKFIELINKRVEDGDAQAG